MFFNAYTQRVNHVFYLIFFNLTVSGITIKMCESCNLLLKLYNIFHLVLNDL